MTIKIKSQWGGGRPQSLPQVSKTVSLECQLQAGCEVILIERGYRRCTAHNAVTVIEQAPAGFFAHLVKAKGNPFLPDLVIMRRDRPQLLVELKVRKYYRPGQKAMIEAGWWHEAWTVEEFRQILDGWEQKGPTDSEEPAGPNGQP